MGELSVVAGVVIAALGLFGVMMRALVKQIEKTLVSEVTRVEQKVDLLREASTSDSDHLLKQMDRQFSFADQQLSALRDSVDDIQKVLWGGRA